MQKAMQEAKGMKDFTSLDVDLQGPVARIWLNQPETRNAFDDTLVTGLTRAFTLASEAREVRVVVLGAHGPAFCAGANLRWMQRMAGYTHEDNLADAARLAEMLRTVAECPKPVIARVQGDAYAGGVGLVAACDIAISVDTAAYCLSETRIGLVPATISPYVLRAMGSRAAQRYFLTAERFDAAEAHRIGLVHEVVAAKALDAKVDELAHALCDNGPAAVRACKRLITEVAGRPIDQTLIDWTVEGIADIRASSEGREGVLAFLEKRKPSWLG